MSAKKILNEFPGFPALAGGLIDQTGTKYIQHYGKLDITKDTMVNNNTTFLIGSCTKSITAAAIMRTLYINSNSETNYTMENITIGKVLTIPINNAYKDVSLKQLLCMHGGINDVNFTGREGAFWQNFINNTNNLYNQRQLLAKIVVGTNAPDPVFQFSYSNIGYTIAVHVVETLFGTTYEKMMKEMFQKLGMKNAHVPTIVAPINRLSAPTGNDALGHAVNGVGKEQYNWQIMFWQPLLRKYSVPPPPIPPKKQINDTIAHVINLTSEYPWAVLGTSGLLRLDMPSWLVYLKAVMTHDNNFLPEDRWNILLNTGMPGGG